MKNSTLRRENRRNSSSRWFALSIIAALLLVATNLFAQGVLGPTNVTTLTGGWLAKGFPYIGYTNGLAFTNNATFDDPCALALEPSGNSLFIADCSNNAVRWISNIQNPGPSTFVYSFLHTNDGLSLPVALTVDGATNVYVLNRGNGTNGYILEYSAILFMEFPQPGTEIFVTTNATHLTNATAMAMDGLNNLYVTCKSNTVIRITPLGVTSIAGIITNAGANLQGIAALNNGLLALSDAGNNGIWMLNPTNGASTMFTGFHGTNDITGPSYLAAFSHPQGIAQAGGGWLVVADRYNHKVKTIDQYGNVYRLFGVISNYWGGSWPGLADGLVNDFEQPYSILKPSVQARQPVGIAVAPNGTVYDTEVYYQVIRAATFTGLPSFPPVAPTGLTATTNYGEVTLTWTADLNATNYNVERATSSGGPYTIIGSTADTTYTDTSVLDGTTYYYVISAIGVGGESAFSSELSVTVPIPAPPSPVIGWYDYEGNTLTGFYSMIHPVSGGDPYVANNPLLIAIDPLTNGIATYYITVPPYTNNTPLDTVIDYGSTPPIYENGVLVGSSDANPLPQLTLSNGAVTIEAVNVDGVGEASAVSTAEFIFEAGTPTVLGINAAQFQVSDVTTDIVFYYTLDGTDPTNAPPSQQIISTNGSAGISLNGSTNIFFQVRAFGYGPNADYAVSGIAQQYFTPGNYSPNSISFGFNPSDPAALDQCYSAFIASPGQTFYAPVTLGILSNTSMFSLQFNITVTNGGPNPGPAVPAGAYYFQSMLTEPIPGTTPPVYENIPTYMFIGYALNPPPPGSIMVFNGTNFVDLQTADTNINLLDVGWLERSRIGVTNLFNTSQQDLIQTSQAHDDVFAQAGGDVILGGFAFQVPTNATLGKTYQLQINRPSATTDGIGDPGSSIYIATPTNGSLAEGTINSIKNVTLGQFAYIVGDSAPFHWFNAGDFGDTNLDASDVAQVFQTAVYGGNAPPAGSDLFDSMDSSGAYGVMDSNPSSAFYGYYTNAGPMTTAQLNAVFSGNDTTINQIAFGDGTLDVSDVYVTYRRSLDPTLTWYSRFWLNGTRVAEVTPNVYNSDAVETSGTAKQSAGGGQTIQPSFSTSSGTVSITNTPSVNFTIGEFVATAGQTIQIPVTATVFGLYPMRVAMLNISVVPLDGSPSLTAPISFTPASILGSPYTTSSDGDNNYAAVWLDSTITGISNSATMGMLTVTIPTNAVSMSSYAVHFDHASGSPNGAASFPRHTLTGLITLSSRTSSYYNDGIPDSWRLRYFGTIYNLLSVSNADADGTGMDNWQKYNAGLNPTDPTSVLTEGLDQSMAAQSSDCVIDWPSVSGIQYVIQRSPTLFPAVWTSISTNNGTGGYMEVHDASGGNNRFYRVSTP